MYNPDNIFAKIINGQIEAPRIYEDDQVIAIRDIKPVAPVHVLVIPKNQYMDYSDFVTNASLEEIGHYFTKIVDIVKILGVEDDGYRIVSNKGTFAGQSVFHFHTHIIAGKQLTDLSDA